MGKCLVHCHIMPPKKSTKSESDDGTTLRLTGIEEKLDLIVSKLSNIESRLNTIESKQFEFEKSLTFYHQQVEETQSKQKLMAASIDVIEGKICKFQALETRIDAAEHAERAKCVELNGIPFQKPEDLTIAYQKIIDALKSTRLPLTGVDKIYRIKQSKRVIIKFTQTTQRNEFFNLYRKNIQPLSALGFKESGNIYINEVLSREQNTLFWKTRKFKNDENYKHVWTYNQRIYLRKTSDSDAVQINSEEDLASLRQI